MSTTPNQSSEPNEDEIEVEVEEDSDPAASPPPESTAFDPAEEVAADEPAPAPPPRPARMSAKESLAAARKKRRQQVKSTAVPILWTIGGLLLAFAFYGLLLRVDVIHDSRENKNVIAYLMMFAGGPIGFVLAAAGLYFFLQLRREKQDEEAAKADAIAAQAAANPKPASTPKPVSSPKPGA